MTVNQERILITVPSTCQFIMDGNLGREAEQMAKAEFLAAQRNRQNYSDLLRDQQMEALVVLGS